MKVTVEDSGPCRRTVRVFAPAEAVANDYDNVLAEFKKAARIPGFRKGNAPLKVVERKFASDIKTETQDRLVPRFYRQALEQKGITPVAVVSVQDVKFDRNTGIEFNVTIDVAPEFKLPKYRKISLKSEEIRIEDKQVDETVKRFLDHYSTFEDVSDRPVKKEDLVSIDYHGECDGRPVSELAPDCSGIGDGKDFWIMLG
ncbi:MAG: hypothetical protein JXN60_08370, partial [Lentisphaerae bacterium]|nr:hypothetical protein [Lentisphaerota bacterium]